MRGIILAAGRGSRLGPLTADRPKCLVPLAGRPLLAWQRDALAAAEVDELAVVAGYRADLLLNASWHTFHAPRWAHTNMVSSLCAAAPWLRTAPCIVAYGDIVYPPDAVRRLVAATGELAITYDPHWLDLWSRRFTDPLEDAETFRLAADGSVAKIGARPSSVAEVEGQFMGLLRFTPQAWAAAEEAIERIASPERDGLQTTGLLRLLIVAGYRVQAVPWPGGWGEVDTAHDLALYEALIDAGQLVLSDKRGVML